MSEEAMDAAFYFVWIVPFVFLFVTVLGAAIGSRYGKPERGASIAFGIAALVFVVLIKLSVYMAPPPVPEAEIQDSRTLKP